MIKVRGKIKYRKLSIELVLSRNLTISREPVAFRIVGAGAGQVLGDLIVIPNSTEN
jgi:hypothetical protein